MILAIGNAGGNIAEAIRREGNKTKLESTKYVFADCNADDLKHHETERCEVICLHADDDSFPTEIFDGVENLIVVAGLGGRTATKFAPLVVEAAKASEVVEITVVVTIPFLFEGQRRIAGAVAAAEKISKLGVTNLKIFNNEGLVKKYPDMSFITAFDTADREMADIVLANI